ncbi:hypothetical protein [Streptococcus merionis]|uniref:hypothetical protein n=1 Tax=Streptococcus merionis TaxID=400065 RepID=UPI0035145BE5
MKLLQKLKSQIWETPSRLPENVVDIKDMQLKLKNEDLEQLKSEKLDLERQNRQLRYELGLAQNEARCWRERCGFVK